MSKHKNLISIILIVFAILLLIPLVVLAWMAFVEKRPMVEFETGKINVSLRANNTEVIDSIDLGDLAFIDFQNDFVLDKYNSLNSLASVMNIRLINNVDSTNIFSEIEVISSSELIYLIIYEGSNKEPLIDDYSSLIKTIIGSETVESNQYQLIDNYNQDSINRIKLDQLKTMEYLSFNIVVWGNHDKLLLEGLNSYNLTLKVKSNQANR